MTDKKNLKKTLENIDKIYSQTIKKLAKLHDKKMELIRQYLQDDDRVGLKKIRRNLKNNL